MNHLGRALTEYDDPPIDVLFVYNCNPAATVPDQRASSTASSARISSPSCSTRS
jgi:anaerobic selenocysteine-containing dehydrogenase